MEFVLFIKNLLWGPPLVILLLGTGLYFTIKSNFLQIRCFNEMPMLFKSDGTKDKGAISPFMALSTALGGTVGVGSIIGVAYSITLGGAGSIFWMWVSGFLGMMTKYAEVAIAVKYRKKEGNIFIGGAMYALDSLGKRKTAILFAVCGLAAALGAGSLTQTNAISELFQIEGVDTTTTAIVIAILLCLIIFKGQKLIAKISSIVVPATSAIYLIVVFAFLLIFRERIGFAFMQIIKGAFGFNAVVGGFAGSLFNAAFKNGLTKGVFSHEAGMGSSPIAHAAAQTATPHIQGLWGIFEVFFDTFVVSTLTALALLSIGTDNIMLMFNLLPGNSGTIFLLIAVSIFAFSAVLAWCFYAESCLKYLSSSPIILFFYRVLFVFSSYLGAVISKGITWELADIFNALMIFPNLALLIICRKEINALIYIKTKTKRKEIVINGVS